MNELNIDQQLAAANPVSEQDAAQAIPPGVGEAMLREITKTERRSVGRRTLANLLGDRRPARVGFVAVLASLVLTAVGLNILAARRVDAPTSTNPTAENATVNSTDVNTPPPDEADKSTVSVVTPDSSSPPTTTAEQIQATTDASSANPQTTTAELPTSTPGPAPQDQAEPCTAEGETLSLAMVAYGAQCDLPRVDCDDLGDGWVCSSEQIGSRPASQNPSAAEYFGDCVSVQAELFPLVGAWRLVDDDPASDGGYIVWDGADDSTSLDEPVDVISVNFTVATPGNYRFVWLMRQPDGVSGDVANDTWVNFPDADRFGPTSSGTFGGFAHVFGYGSNQFVWAGKADQGAQQPDIAIEFAASGIYTMQLAGRSPGHQIDRIIVYPESVNRGDATAGRCR